MEVELFEKLSRYPFIYKDELFNSPDLKQNKSCLKCEKRDCLQLFSSNINLGEYVCSKYYNNFLLIVGDLKVILNGLILNTNSIIPRGTRELKKEWICNDDAISLFVSKIQEIENHIVDREKETTIKNFSIFHDFKTSMNIFFSCTQEIISALPGNSFEEKLNSSNKSHQDLYRSLSLITSQLRMIDILINPGSITFGNRKHINIYRLFDKMKMLFEHMTNIKRDISITISHEGWINDSLCYESIEFIPLILLDNALKYSVPGYDVEIKIERSYGKANVIVKNIGPLVKEENKEKIFEKFFRDESAQNFSKEGIGIGLWVAQKVLEAHGTKLSYFKNPQDTGKIGLNIFSFELPTITT